MDKKAVDLFAGVTLLDFASVKDSMEYKTAFSSMVTEYEKRIMQPLTHAAVDSLVNNLGSDLYRFKDKRKRKGGIDARTFSQARNGVIPAPPWLFAAVCYLLGVRVKDKLQEIKESLGIVHAYIPVRFQKVSLDGFFETFIYFRKKGLVKGGFGSGDNCIDCDLEIDTNLSNYNSDDLPLLFKLLRQAPAA